MKAVPPTIAQHQRKLRATVTPVVPEFPEACRQVHEWMCEALERARIAHEQKLAQAQTAFAKQRRLARARNEA